MKINTLIEKLQALAERHGDVEVEMLNYEQYKMKIRLVEFDYDIDRVLLCQED